MIAQRDGASLGYMCMGNHETVEWAFNVIETLISEYGADWLKFDFNLDPGAGCNRTDHGHGEGDGLYEHYMGYFLIFVFRLSGGEKERVIKLRGLDEDAIYSISYKDGKKCSEKSSIELTEIGLEFSNIEEEGSEIVLLERKN